MRKFEINGYSKSEGQTLYYLHKIILQALHTYEKGKLLEVGPGQLRLWKQIEKLHKFEMFGCDLNYPNELIVYCNLNKDNLPYNNEFFDYVICCEVIEHIHNPWSLLSEIRRVMKTEGRLIITTPNVSKIYDRIYYLVKGVLPSFEQTKFTSEMQHINPINIQELMLILHENGFRIGTIRYNVTKKYQRLFPCGLFGYSVAVFAYKE